MGEVSVVELRRSIVRPRPLENPSMMRPPVACSSCGRAKPCGCFKQVRGTEAKPFSKGDYKGQNSKLYDRSRWRHPTKGLQACILRRDIICRICNRAASTVADHIRDHHGDEALFFDPTNLQGLCKWCHDQKTGREHGQRNREASPQAGVPRTVGKQ